MTVTDANGDAITKYRVKDTTGINNFVVSGSAVDATGVDGYEFNANVFSTLSVKGDSSTGSQTLQIAAYDGTTWSAWRNFVLVTAVNSNNLPVVSIANQVLSVDEKKDTVSYTHLTLPTTPYV